MCSMAIVLPNSLQSLQHGDVNQDDTSDDKSRNNSTVLCYDWTLKLSSDEPSYVLPSIRSLSNRTSTLAVSF